MKKVAQLLLTLLVLMMLFACNQEKAEVVKPEKPEKLDPFVHSSVPHICLDNRNNVHITFIYDNWEHDFQGDSPSMAYLALDQQNYPDLAIYYYRFGLSQNLSSVAELADLYQIEFISGIEKLYEVEELYYQITEVAANDYFAISLGYLLSAETWGRPLVLRIYLVSEGETIVFFQAFSAPADSENTDKVVKSMLETIVIEHFEQ